MYFLIREDLEHKLLSGGVIYLDGCPTYKVTLEDMANYGFTRMQNVIALMSSDDSSASRFLNVSVGDEKISIYYVLVVGILQELAQNIQSDVEQESLLSNSIPAFLSLFFKRDVCFDENNGFVVKDTDGTTVFVLNEENYNQFRIILKCRNCLSDLSDAEDENPANEMAAKLLAKKKMLREKIHKSKKSRGEDGVSMADLISIFAEAEGMPLQDVYKNYDMYQFNNQFNRLKIMDDFHVNIQALLAGAKSEDIKLQHWLSKIKKEEQ